MKYLRILLADDHQVLRAGLKLLLSSQPDMRLVAEAGSGEETLQKARQFKPDLVIMDLSMPGMNGLKATEALKEEMPQMKILILTSHEDPSYFRQMCKANASGYVLKRSAGEELLHAIRKVAKGQLHFDDELATNALTRQFGATTAGNGPARNVTEREEEVLRGVALGYTNKEIASQFSLSVKTIETHKVRICEKLGFRSRADMVQFALRQGWLDPNRSSAQLSR
jgi:two-component system, NarL family, response regulator NreC